MKFKYLFLAFIIIAVTSCKKEATVTIPPSIFSFDFEGTHHAFNIGQLTLQVIDTGASKGKYLTLYTGNTSLPQVLFTIADRTNNYGANCFSSGPYPALGSNAACHDSIMSNFCVGFFMQYTDTGVGKVGLYATNDSTSSLTLISCNNGVNGLPSTVNATFSCVLTDTTGFISPKHITNGVLSNIIYSKN